MAFFDKLKNIANKITGGGASVSVSVSGNKINEPISVTIHAVVKDAPIQISKVYLYVKSEEVLNIPNKHITSGNDSSIGTTHITEDVFNKQEFVVAPAQTLEAGKSYEWTYNLVLPSGVSASYTGKYANHEWKILAGLDASGNDPDSGWQNVHLS